MKSNQYVVSVDMGGTSIRAADVSSEGVVGQIRKAPTYRKRQAREILNVLSLLVEEVRTLRGGRAEALCVGVPVPPTPDGCLRESGNLPSMTGFPILKELEIRFGIPVLLENDANCFALGEWWKGEAAGYGDFCGVTIGTGLGAGLILNGRLHKGCTGFAGEIWNVPMADGRRLEDVLSGPGLAAAYAMISGAEATAERIAGMAREGDPAACKTFSSFGIVLGCVLAFASRLLELKTIVLGGSVSKSYDCFQKSMTEALGAVSADVNVLPSVLGDKAALAGAAFLWWEGNGGSIR